MAVERQTRDALSQWLKPHALPLATLTAAVLAVFLPFLLKRQYMIENDFEYLSWSAGGDPLFFRWVAKLYFHAVFPIFKFNSSLYLSINVLIHYFNALLVFVVCKKLTNKRAVALLAALIFMVHYINYGVTLWALMIAELFSTFFSLIAILCFMQVSQEESQTRRALFYGFSLISFTLSVLSRATSLVLPLLILAYGMLWSETKQRRITALARSAPFMLLSIGYCLVVTIFFAKADHSLEKLLFFTDKPVFTVVNCISALSFLVTPFDFAGADDWYIQPYGHGWVVPLILLLSFLAIGFLSRNKVRKLSFLWITFPVLLVAIACRGQVYERYLYFPSIGVSLMLSLLIFSIASIFRQIKSGIMLYPLAFLLLASFFISHKHRQAIRTEVGSIVNSGYATVMKKALAKGKKSIIYAFNFPIRINRCPGFNEALQVGIREYEKLGFFDKVFSVDSRDLASDITTVMYALSMPFCQKKLHDSLEHQKHVILYGSREKYGQDTLGIDNRVPKHYGRFVFAYDNGSVLDLSEAFFPETRVDFCIKAPHARTVSIVGDFNAWDHEANLLTRDPRGYWVGSITLKPGKYLYQFLIDDALQCENPASTHTVSDPKRGRCSVLAIPNPALPFGLLPTADKRIDQLVLRCKERLLRNPCDASSHALLAKMYKQRGFIHEAALELQAVHQKSSIEGVP